MRESEFEASVCDRIRTMFPGCVILKNDTRSQQGIPDRLILWGGNWAMLEIKANKTAKKQPNQQYYVDKLNHMSFAAIIYPENESEVLHALQRSFSL